MESHALRLFSVQMSRLGACPAGERDSYAVTHFRPMQLEGSGCFAKLYEFTGKVGVGSIVWVILWVRGDRAMGRALGPSELAGRYPGALPQAVMVARRWRLVARD